MIDQGIESRPQYESLRLDPTGRRHLLLVAEPHHRPDGFAAAKQAAETWIVVPRDSGGVAGIPLPGEA